MTTRFHRASGDLGTLPNLDMPSGRLSVGVLFHVVALGRPDVGMTGQLLDLVHGCTVVEGIRNRRLPERQRR